MYWLRNFSLSLPLYNCCATCSFISISSNHSSSLCSIQNTSLMSHRRLLSSSTVFHRLICVFYLFSPLLMFVIHSSFSTSTSSFVANPCLSSSSSSSSLHWEHQEARESGIFPPSHEVSPLQFEVGPVPLLHLDQNTIAGSLTCHILVTSECRNHRPAIVHQAHLD